MAAHLTLCPRCRSVARTLETVGGAMLEDTAPGGSVRWPWPRKVDAPSGVRIRRDREAPQDQGLLPRPIQDYTGLASEIPWRTVLGGAVAYVELPMVEQGVPVRLKRLRAGVHVPLHGHGGFELELVLAGGVSDSYAGRQYVRGDVAVHDETTTHSLDVHPDGPCLVLGVHAGPLKPIGLWSRFVYGLLGW